MPCDSSYMEPTEQEINLSRVATLLDVVKGGKKFNRNHYYGYHPRVYNQATRDGKVAHLDKLTAELCGLLQKAEVIKYPLEVQIWWRDHQEADRARAAREKIEKKDARTKKRAIGKLSRAERKAIGI